MKTQLGRTDTLAVIERTIPAVPLPLAERQAEIARVDSATKGYATVNVDYSQIPSVKPVIVDLSVDDAGRLWVRRSTYATIVDEDDVQYVVRARIRR